MVPRLTPASFARRLWHILRGRPAVPASLHDNALLQTVLRRRTTRRFTSDQIPDDVFTAILEAGRLAPSTVNLQTWSFAVFDAAGWRERFGAGIPFRGARAVVVLGDTHRDKRVLDVFPRSPLVEYTVAVMNASLAAMNMAVAAEALGVSSVMLSETGRTGVLDAGFLRERLALPAGVFPLMTVVFGYRSGPAMPMPPKLPLDAICFSGEYRETSPAELDEWLGATVAGYKAMRPLSSFEAQLGVYRSKIEQAERDLQALVYGEGPPPQPPTSPAQTLTPAPLPKGEGD